MSKSRWSHVTVVWSHNFHSARASHERVLSGGLGGNTWSRRLLGSGFPVMLVILCPRKCTPTPHTHTHTHVHISKHMHTHTLAEVTVLLADAVCGRRGRVVYFVFTDPRKVSKNKRSYIIVHPCTAWVKHFEVIKSWNHISHSCHTPMSQQGHLMLMSLASCSCLGWRSQPLSGLSFLPFARSGGRESLGQAVLAK